MKVKTKYLGEIEIEESDIIYFPKGLPGFEDSKKFVMVRIEDNENFYVLQDIEEEYISFIVVNPWDFYQDYRVEVKDEILGSIGIDRGSEKEVNIYNIINLGDSLRNSTCNLLAPIIINVEDRKARQVILNDLPYTTKHKLMSEEGAKC